MNMQENVPLAPLTTFKVGGPARYFAESKTLAEVSAAVDFAGAKALPLFVLGGGSNLVISDAGWPGVVLKVAVGGIDERSQKGKTIFEVEPGSVKKRMKDKAFARGVSRDDLVKGAEELGVPIEEHMATCIEAMCGIAESLGLERKS